MNNSNTKNSDNDQDDRKYTVVINTENRYSLWLDYKEIPWGWKAIDFTGNKQECLDYIASIWTDMRPLNTINS